MVGILEDKDRIFTNLYGLQDWQAGGGEAARHLERHGRMLAQTPDWICDQIKTSGLRGRGGAGFNTGLKWTFMPKDEGPRPHYLVVNADKSEPGTCKDREIMRHEPHRLIEGCLIACRAMRRTRLLHLHPRRVRARARAPRGGDRRGHAAGLIGQDNIHGWDFEILVAHGAGAYICGEETGAAREPRGQEGPAAAEAAVPGRRRPLRLPDHGQQRRVDRGRRRRSCAAAPAGSPASAAPNNTGTKLICVSGHVNKPCNVEEAMSIPLSS